MKRILSVCTCLILCVVLCIPIMAQTVVPFWNGVDSAGCLLTFNGTTGTVSASIRGGSNVTAIQGTLKLYWGIFKLDEWIINESDNYWHVLETFDAVSGRNYKLKLDAQAYSDGAWEDVSDEYSAECP